MIALRLLRDGAVVREALFAALPVSLGRGPENAVVIADASVSRNHARLEHDAAGKLVLTDLGSVNGLHSGPTRVPQLSVSGVVRCRLGSVEIEIEPVSEDPTLEVSVPDWHHLEQRRGLGHHAMYLGVGVLGFAVTELMTPGFWSPWQRSRVSELLGSVFGGLLLLPLLAFLLFVALKAAGRRVRVADTLCALARLVWLMPLWFALTSLAYYLLGSGALALASQALTWAALVVAILSLVTLRRTGRGPGFALAWVAAVTVLWAGLGLTRSLASQRLGMPENAYTVLPPAAGFPGSASDLDAYLEDVRAASEQAAAAAEEVRVSQEP